MSDLELRIRSWTDQATLGAEPIAIDDVFARSLEAAVPGPERSSRPRWPLVAAAVVLLGLAAGATLLWSQADDGGSVATDPEPVAPHVPSAYDLFPAGAVVRAQQPPATDAHPDWQSELGVEPDDVDLVVQWEEAGSTLTAITPVDEAAVWAAGDPRFAGFATDGEHRGVRTRQWDVPTTEPTRSTPIESSRVQAQAVVGDTLVVASDEATLLAALDRHLDGEPSVGRAPGFSDLLPWAMSATGAEVYAAPFEAERWYSTYVLHGAGTGSGGGPAAFAAVVAEGVDPEQVRAGIEDALAPATQGSSGLRLSTSVVRLDGRVVEVTRVDGHEEVDVWRNQILLAGGAPDESWTWLWLLGAASLIAVLVGWTWRAHSWRHLDDVEVLVAVERSRGVGGWGLGGHGGQGPL